jgi:hypothetical protein
VSVLVAAARPAYFLPLRLRFPTTAFAIVFLLVLPNPLHVTVRPEAHHDAPNMLFSGDSKLFRRNPTLQGDVVNTGPASCFRRRAGCHR